MCHLGIRPRKMNIRPFVQGSFGLSTGLELGRSLLLSLLHKICSLIKYGIIVIELEIPDISRYKIGCLDRHFFPQELK